MIAYVVHRLLQTAVMLVLLSVLFFLLAHFSPPNACGYTSIGCQHLLHLDEPLTQQYLDYIGGIVHGNFGLSVNGNPVGVTIAQRLPATVLLIGVSFLLQQFIALPLGVFAALRPYSRFDGALTVLSYLFLSLPAFVLGELAIYVFCLHLGWLPPGHDEDLALPLVGDGDWFASLVHDPGYVLGDLVRHLVLPAFVLMATGIAVDSRFMRGAMLQVLRQDYMRTARAKGLPRRLVIFKHAFRNALLPIVTNIGLYLPALVGGVVVVETVFSYGGLGYLFGTSITDFNTLQALLLLSAVAVLLANLLADLAYAWLDPRIRYDAGAA